MNLYKKKGEKMKRKILLIVLALFLTANISLSKNASPSIIKALQKKLEVKQNSDITFIGRWSLKNNMQLIEIKGMQLKGVRISKIDANITTGKTKIILTLQDLKDSFLAKNQNIKSINISFKKGNLVCVTGKVELATGLVTIKLEGKFFLKNKQISYTVTKASMGIIPVPKGLVNTLLKRTNPVFKLNKLGKFSSYLYLQHIKYEGDQVILYGSKSESVSDNSNSNNDDE